MANKETVIMDIENGFGIACEAFGDGMVIKKVTIEYEIKKMFVEARGVHVWEKKLDAAEVCRG